MDKVKELFLVSIRASLRGQILDWNQEVTQEEWKSLFELARNHSVLPIVYDGVSRSTAFQESGDIYDPQLRMMSMQNMFLQFQKSKQFLEMYGQLRKAGLKPVVVKGLVCRELYPNPDLRSSNDEDIYIRAVEYEKYQEILNSLGFLLQGSDSEESENVYVHQKTGLMLEIHQELMDMELSAISDMNVLFEGALERAIELDIQGNSICTLSHTDHLLFLILHALKHFISGGFGIRQLLDILIFSTRYGSEIDWKRVLDGCRRFRAEKFALAMFHIGNIYFDYNYEKAGIDAQQCETVDPMPLLEDMLDAGIYGNSSMSRKHSAGITTNTLQAQYEGRKNRKIVTSLFPKVSLLKDRYTYLEKKPWLLPVAWIQRIWGYYKETSGNKSGNSMAESIRIGNERVELMRQYGIIK